MDLKEKYFFIYSDLKTKGSKNRLYFLFMLLIGLIYAFGVVESKYERYHWERMMTNRTLYLIVLGSSLFWVLIVLMTNSITFINKKKLNLFRYNFKQDFIQKLKADFPEIRDYIFNQKIHPKTFNNSQLFKSKFPDYYGDDWIAGEYKNVQFELCELNVFKLFHHIFHGLFIICRFPNNVQCKVDLSPLIADFNNQHSSKIRYNIINNRIYLAIELKDKFMECTTSRQINSVDRDLELIMNILNLLKEIINKNTGANKG